MDSILRYSPNRLHITFMSGSTGLLPYYWASQFNKEIQYYFGGLGIVVFDFPGEDAISHVINQNSIYQSGYILSAELITLAGGISGYEFSGSLTTEIPTVPYPNYFACGVGLRVSKFGQKLDLISDNGLIMTFCHRDNWLSNASLPAFYGNWGDWKFVNCPNGFFINGGSVRY